MKKPRIIIADTDINYIIPLQLKFVEDFFEEVELEIITDKNYFNELLSSPQQAEILIVSEDMYVESVHRHNISHVFLMTEQYDESHTNNLNVTCIFKYTSIKEIFNEIIGISSDVFNFDPKSKETQVVVFYSASGGAGKTTAAIGVSASLTKNYKRVLYINASYLQNFQHMLENPSAIAATDIYPKLASNSGNIYADIKFVIRKELFHYLPPFRATLMSLGLNYSVYERIILSAKKSGDFDFIIVDTDTTFDEAKASLLGIADKVVILTNQSKASVTATNNLVSNINGINAEKYIFICNNFDKDEDNALISPNVSLKFTVSDYIEHFRYFEKMSPNDISKESGIQRTAFLVI